MQGWCNVYVRFKYYNLIKEREAIIYGDIRFMQGWCNVYVRFKYYNLIKEREAIIYE